MFSGVKRVYVGGGKNEGNGLRRKRNKNNNKYSWKKIKNNMIIIKI